MLLILVSTLLSFLLLAAQTRAESAPAPASPAAGRKSAFGKPAPRSQPPSRRREVLDIERLRVVSHGKEPNAIPTCDVLVVGGGLGGVAAAEALARQGRAVIMAEPTSSLGGQLTAQVVPCPDENAYIERHPGVGTLSYRLLREQVRRKYAAMPGIKPGRAANVGACWVSRISGEPAVWESAIRERLDALRGSGGIRDVLLRSQLISVHQGSYGQANWADFVNLDTGRITRVGARFVLDASELGDGLEKAGSPWTVGAEGRDAHGEPSAPETPRPDWVQSMTYCFVARWQPEGPHPLVEKPAEYEYFRSLGEYTLGYDYSDGRGRVYYKVFSNVPGGGGPFWTYRRLAAASSFSGNPKYAQDLALINWRGNDFHEEHLFGKSLADQVRILKRARDFARGFLYWLQTECPRDDGSGPGYPEMQPAVDLTGTVDGFAIHPYIRESRRLLAEFTLTENHLAPDPGRPERKWGEEFPDTVGIALYAMDIHPSKGEPPKLSRALPYHLPLGAFIPRSGPENVLPAAKNFGATRLALASARMHPTEWLAGEVAGHLAAFCLRRNVEPRAVRQDPSLLAAFQQQLADGGIPLRWSEVLR